MQAMTNNRVRPRGRRRQDISTATSGTRQIVSIRRSIIPFRWRSDGAIAAAPEFPDLLERGEREVARPGIFRGDRRLGARGDLAQYARHTVRPVALGAADQRGPA